ncbi:rCG24047 [Rattus norvegicus]|uniref:RCG24047 n=1 Tax=Rattus norvegicus TaxID=10116 RepID=A6JSU2_RAT|nr:rCG24047 [Rattus norvegicus]
METNSELQDPDIVRFCPPSLPASGPS